MKSLDNILKDYARSDIETAFINGSNCITETKSGVIEVKYLKTSNKYQFIKWNTGEVLRENLTGFQAIDFLSNLYQVKES